MRSWLPVFVLFACLAVCASAQADFPHTPARPYYGAYYASPTTYHAHGYYRSGYTNYYGRPYFGYGYQYYPYYRSTYHYRASDGPFYFPASGY